MSDGDRDDGREFDADSGFGPGPDAAGSVDGGGDFGDDADALGPAAGDDAASRMRGALSEVREEARKVAFLHALLDAGLVALAVNVLLRLFRPAALGDAVDLPGFLAGAGGVVPNTIHTASIVGLLLGVAAFAGEYLLRTRRPLVEQFEAGNPSVAEALRTARDTVEDGANTEMARRLYEDVLADLRETSSFELVGTRRVVVTTLLIVLVSLASIQVAVVDLDLTDALDGDDDDAPVEQPQRTEAEDELRDGDEILGDAENVSAGDESINASVQGSDEGEGEGGSVSPPSSYDDGGFADAAVEGQDAGYAPSENIEDAELIREYNLRIRDDDEADDEDDT
ncbi:hypothetical protein C474_20886 [Halogeometricum pallidum JCM 14848]|uniref:Uncharacterized protein n=1 Tax=Halogeometricum pallidum JCM 14848 TaxID=1227487 RepID=M0CSL0_HALPD|nr:hypothetical protein [Halogeometricum pallidum]ELZ26196.1 hypothetical protein C474_20886 [Halogeometricum pallidum JCM 14848]